MEKRVSEDFDIALGAVMRKYRVAKGYSTEDVGTVLGCSKQMISLYELGKNSIAVSQLKKAGILYGVSYADLIREACEMIGEIIA